MSGRRSGDPPSPSPGRRGAAASAEDGLRALGRRIDGEEHGGEEVPEASSVANESGLRALGEAVDRQPPRSGGGAPPRGADGGGGGKAPGGRGSRRRRWSTRRKVVTGLVLLLVLLLMVAGAVYGYVRYTYDQIPKVHVASEQQQISGQPFNMLVIGSDSRVGENSSQFGSTSQVAGQRSDVVMIWHVDPATKQVSLLSIPRDTLVQMEGANVSEFGQFNRINSAYNSGPNLLVQTIESNFGIPINHVIQVDFAGLTGAVNALGGIYLDFPYPAKDTYSGLNITTPGCQLVNGSQALAVARSRHYQYYANGQWNYDPSGDLGRIQRQDAFLRALFSSAKSKYNPFTIGSFLGAIPKGITIDDQLSLSDMIGLAEDFHSMNVDALAAQTLPTISNGYVSPWGDVLFVDQPAAQQMLTSIFGHQLQTPNTPPPNTNLVPTPPPAVSPTTAPPASGTAPPSSAPTTSSPSFDPAPCTPH